MPAQPPSNQPPKLRSSCDGCNTTKVKCTKTRPSCARCQSHDLECVYSVSMRSHKQRAARNTVILPPPSVRNPSDETTATTDTSTTQDSSHLATPRTPPMETNSVLESNLSSIMASMSNGVPGAEWASNLLDGDRFDPLAMWMDMDHPMQSASPEQTFSFIRGTGKSKQPSRDEASGAVQDPVFNCHHAVPPSPMSFLQQAQTCPGGTASETGPHVAPATMPVSSCCCRQSIMEKLVAHCRTSSVPISFDVALNQNKADVALCNSILNCSKCTHHSGTFILILVALITQVIDIYNGVCSSLDWQATGPSQHSGATETGDTDMAFTSNSSEISHSVSSINLHEDTPFHSSASMARPSPLAVPVRLTLGAYHLDKQDEERLRMDLFNIELSKVATLVKGFEERFCNTNLQRNQVKDESKLSQQMVHYLEKRLRCSFEVLRQRASRACYKHDLYR